MKAIILIGISLGCGLVAAVGVSRYLGDKQNTGTPAATVKIVVAKGEININEALSEDKLELADWPQDRVPQGAIEAVDKIANMYARTRLYPGAPVLTSMLVGSSEGTRALTVPLGYRVVAVKMNAESSVSSLVQPGDRVDVVVVIRNNERTMSKTILRAVRVFAVNSETERSTEQPKAPSEARTASLLVTPDQAEKVLMGADLGQLRLALRSPEDLSVEETKGCNINELLGRGEVADNSLGKESHAGATIHSGEPRWTMQICSPQNTAQFRWSGPGGFPERVEKSVRAETAATKTTTADAEAGEGASDNSVPDAADVTPQT